MAGLCRHLSAAGHSCFAPSLKPSDGRPGLAFLSEQLAQFVGSSIPAGDRFALVGYSMGALVCRHYLQELGGRHRVDAFFSIAGPHHGTLTAYLYPGRGARDMRPRSAFVRHLDGTSGCLSDVPITCYWSPTDTVIRPPSSSRMEGAGHVRLLISFHPLLTFDRRIYRDIELRLSALKPNKTTEPTSGNESSRMT